jgi:hypothetical protein
MQKWKSVVFLTFLALAGLVVGIGRVAKNQKASGMAAPSTTASASAPKSAGVAPAAEQELPPPGEASAAPNSSSEPLAGNALPANAPNDVVFGAILITYEGAQGASSKARPKQAALELAQRILATAQASFEDAVKMGDPGSMANAGTMRRGILEPNVERALFTLDKGAVFSEPLETPRGYWVMRRIR